MAGYTRQDTANNIANGNVIDADDFDAEYNAIEGAFNNTSGHTHDGTAGEGAPITKVGPAQDLIVSGVAVMPKSTNTLDLGSAAVQYKDAFFDGTVNTDDITVDGTATIASTLGVTGVTTLGNNLNVAGAAGVDGDFDVNTNKFTVNATTGNTAVAGTLGVTGAATVGGTLGITGVVNAASALNVSGAAGVDGNFDVATNKFTVDSQSGNTNVAGVLSVTGNINGASALNVTGNAGIDGNFDVATNKFTVSSTTGNTFVAGTLSAAGNTTVGGTLGVTDATTLNNTLGVTGATTLNSTLGVTGNTTVGGTLAVTGASTLTGAVSAPAGVTGNVVGNLAGNVTSTGANSMASLTTTGDVVVGGNLTVSGTTTTVNTETINLADNIISLNSNYSGFSPTENSGIEINRGTQANKTLVWDEAADKWTVGSETFVAGTFEGALSGNASTATSAAQLTTARTISLNGGVTGSASFNGGSNITITATVADDSHNHTIANVDGLQAAINAAFPSGGIVMWSGSIASIPSGWALCNGANGTPNLLDRFIVGAGSGYGVGATGGNKDAIVVAHSHSASTNTVGDHTHDNYYTNGSYGEAGSGVPLSDFSGTYSSGKVGFATSGAGSHSHTVTVNSTGSSGTNANLPPYYALAYIMKL